MTNFLYFSNHLKGEDFHANLHTFKINIIIFVKLYCLLPEKQFFNKTNLEHLFTDKIFKSILTFLLENLTVYAVPSNTNNKP